MHILAKGRNSDVNENIRLNLRLERSMCDKPKEALRDYREYEMEDDEISKMVLGEGQKEIGGQRRERTVGSTSPRIENMGEVERQHEVICENSRIRRCSRMVFWKGQHRRIKGDLNKKAPSKEMFDTRVAQMDSMARDIITP